jgi:hypothetical protein
MWRNSYTESWFLFPMLSNHILFQFFRAWESTFSNQPKFEAVWNLFEAFEFGFCLKSGLNPRRPALCRLSSYVGAPLPPDFSLPLSPAPRCWPRAPLPPGLTCQPRPHRVGHPAPPFSPSPTIVWHARADPLPCLTPPLLQKVPAATPAPSFSPFSLAHGHMSSTPSFPASSPSRMSRNELPSAAFLPCPRHLHPPWWALPRSPLSTAPLGPHSLLSLQLLQGPAAPPLAIGSRRCLKMLMSHLFLSPRHRPTSPVSPTDRHIAWRHPGAPLVLPGYTLSPASRRRACGPHAVTAPRARNPALARRPLLCWTGPLGQGPRGFSINRAWQDVASRGL